MPLIKAKPLDSVKLGDLIAAAYEEAYAIADTEEEAARLAAIAVSDLLARTRNEQAMRDMADSRAD